MIYTRNPQTPEEWLDYVNTIQKRPVTRGQPTPQRGFDRWQPESTPPPSQGNQPHRADINPDHKDVIPHQGKDQHNDENGEEHPVQYFSRSLRKYEQNYSISELECLAIIESIEYFRVYLLGRHFTIYSDHQALVYLKNIKNPSATITCQDYLTIRHNNKPREWRWVILPDDDRLLPGREDRALERGTGEREGTIVPGPTFRQLGAKPQALPPFKITRQTVYLAVGVPGRNNIALVVSCPWSRSDRSVHPDHSIDQLRCLSLMDVHFWIDVCHIEGCKDGRVYMVRRTLKRSGTKKSLQEELGVVDGVKSDSNVQTETDSSKENQLKDEKPDISPGSSQVEPNVVYSLVPVTSLDVWCRVGGTVDLIVCGAMIIMGYGGVLSMMMEDVLLWRGDRSLADLLLEEVRGSSISVVVVYEASVDVLPTRGPQEAEAGLDVSTESYRGQPTRQRLTPGFHRRAKAKTSLEDDDVPIDDTTTKPLFTPQEKGRKAANLLAVRLRPGEVDKLSCTRLLIV
ncbi:K02A2.6-like [Cordylochernes scorpioides]|uniref:K02A2.6-like n=1 Tax=Cordylochernes scorpioides TaxID=51811 RepID=A0ABY6LQT4_9ARAC|nr:K02A2.6-like [Cordylochernes scorpioides]